MKENAQQQERAYPVIGPESKFYGYVIGLNLEPWEDNYENGSRRLLATFEYSGTVTTWEVPDLELWEMLWRYLKGNGWHRNELGEYGYDKVFIEKKDSGWDVDLS